VDWDRLRFKIDKGADFVITQLFFDNTYYFEMRDYLVKNGVLSQSFRALSNNERSQS
jgi:5,10-methylenetetrahydrofolate reductase